jgi:hypothetical protein
MTEKSKTIVPPEAAAIMSKMVRMPPKPHEDMKVGKPAQKAPKNPNATQQPKKHDPK